MDELTLTALGGSFDADTNFVPPASANVVPTGNWLPDKPGNPLFDAFSIERWQQNTRLLAAISGSKSPTRDPVPARALRLACQADGAALHARAGGLRGRPGRLPDSEIVPAYRCADQKYPALSQPNGGRRWPVEQLEILTRVTPDILDPMAASPSDDKPFTMKGQTVAFSCASTVVTNKSCQVWPSGRGCGHATAARSISSCRSTRAAQRVSRRFS